jgi:hypothetical protein
MFWWTGSVVLRAAGFSQTPVVGGDARSSSIAAASIGANVTRDSLMGEFARLHSGYGFERHKGYPTAGPYPCAGAARSAAAPSPFIRARVDGGRGATAAWALG